MCGGKKQTPPPAPKPDPTIATRGADTAAEASGATQRRVADGSVDPQTLGGSGSPAPGGVTASVLGG
jgi:hypothetical protein